MRVEDMPAGPEIDALVAEKVMGWQRRTFKGQNPRSLWNDKDIFDAMIEAGLTHEHNGEVMSIPAYSTDIAAAWQVVQHLREKYAVPGSMGGGTDFLFRLEWEIMAHIDPLQCWDRWIALFKLPNSKRRGTYADTASLAICRTALLACGVTEVPSET